MRACRDRNNQKMGSYNQKSMRLNPKMKKRLPLKQCFFVLLILISIIFLDSFGDVSTQSKEYSEVFRSEKLGLFIIHIDSLMCFPCLNPFLDFYKLLPSPFRENRLHEFQGDALEKTSYPASFASSMKSTTLGGACSPCS